MSLAAVLAELQHLRRDISEPSELTSRVVALESAQGEGQESAIASPVGPVTVNYVTATSEQLLASPVPSLPSFSASSVLGPVSEHQAPLGLSISEAERR